jgi:hypothetical protein
VFFYAAHFEVAKNICVSLRLSRHSEAAVDSSAVGFYSCVFVSIRGPSLREFSSPFSKAHPTPFYFFWTT